MTIPATFWIQQYIGLDTAFLSETLALLFASSYRKLKIFSILIPDSHMDLILKKVLKIFFSYFKSNHKVTYTQVPYR